MYLQKYTRSLSRFSSSCVKSLFVNKLKRFIARHGTTKLFISDIARKFIELEVQEYISHANIDCNLL